ncbi:MAG TPA: NAD-dependent epimerase/dehydratase family protein [Thermoleophilaceae bacterium]|nr:NAD-dependent epimerase/dehydratase family protein [Thermoleophilaceae bacterium]
MGKTLVTGASGFIGSHVARRLAERGDDLRITLRDGSSEEALGGLECERVRCDLLDRRAVRRALRDVERVFHVAGQTSLRRRDAELLYRVNVDATRLLMEECLSAGVERVVYTSSVAAIGPAPPGERADETQVFTAGDLRLPYVSSKHEAEVEALRVAARGLPLVCVNPTIVFGSGDVNGGSTGLVRRFLLGRVSAYVDGGLNIVDVEDVAAGHLLADEKGREGERYILGGRNYTLRRLFADLGRVAGVEPPPLRLSPEAALGLARLAERSPVPAPIAIEEVVSASQWWTYSSARAKRELGWSARPHDETLEATVGWWVERERHRIVHSQPVQVRLAARAVDGLEGMAGVAGRLLGRS